MANPNYTGNPVDDLSEWAGTVPASIQSSAGDCATAPANTAVVITLLAPPAPYANVLTGVAWSYSGGTPAGSIKIEDGAGNVVFNMDIITADPDSITFPQPRRFTAATDTIVTLAAGGSGVTGKLNLIGRYSDAVGGLTA